MDNEQKQSLKKSIQIKLTTLEKKLQILQKELKPLEKSCACDNAEYSSLYHDYHIRYNEIKNLQKHVTSLQKASIMIDNDEYGICKGCGEEIPFARLELIPESSYCVECLF